MKRFYFLFKVCLLLSLTSVQSFASTILQVDVSYLLSHSTLVFEGKVLSQQPQWNTAHTNIFTAITFRVDDVIKGRYNEPTITLNFSGGIVGNQGMRVSSLVYPQVNKKGIYFVESSDKNLVNPLVGWSQGHFLLETDSDGVERIFTEAGAPVLNFSTEPVTANNFLPSQSQAGSAKASKPSHSDTAFSKGVAKGLDIGEIISTGDAQRQQKLKSAVRKSLFKNALSNKLKQDKPLKDTSN